MMKESLSKSHNKFINLTFSSSLLFSHGLWPYLHKNLYTQHTVDKSGRMNNFMTPEGINLFWTQRAQDKLYWVLGLARLSVGKLTAAEWSAVLSSGTAGQQWSLKNRKLS
ncbi:hypothetical protein OAS86_04485 [Gammaproteobacteria bacterium]|nr:hypothetical protein [Gammaproteobacteria bacterium]